VLKADAYGTAAPSSGPRLAREGLQALLRCPYREASALRRVLPDPPIYVLNGMLPGTEGDFVGTA